MIKYIGSKRVLVPWITSVIEHVHAVSPITTVVDLFSGSARVAYALKQRGFSVHANDLYSYAFVIAKCLVEADADKYPREMVEPYLQELQALEGKSGYFTEQFCINSSYFQVKNGVLIDAMREHIDLIASRDPQLHAILLSSLMLAADRVDSTTGVQMAYLKQYAPRSNNALRLLYPALLPGAGKATQEDAIELAPSLHADLVYLDPPYNQHSYISNYHIWETLVLNDCPNAYGIARKREDCKVRKSPFNFKRDALQAMKALVNRIPSKHLLVSFSNEGFYGIDEMENLLRDWGHVRLFTKEHKRYIGSQIGIYNPKGEKVGKISHLNNQEFLIFATKNSQVAESLDECPPLMLGSCR